MPINAQSVGKDLSFVLSTPSGTLNISGVTGYSVRRKSTMLTSKRLGGRIKHGVIPDGYEITINLDRTDSTLDDFFANQDAAYYAGVNIASGTIYETIGEVNGSTSQYRYTEVVLDTDSLGDWKGDSFIPVKLTAYATERQKV